MHLSTKLFLSIHLVSCLLLADEMNVQKTLSQLTLEQKIGQLFVIPAVSSSEINKEFMAHEPYTMDEIYVKQMIQEYQPGGVIFLGAGFVQQQFDLTQEFQALSQMPLLICQDAEWGLSMRLRDGFRFPHNMALGALSQEHEHVIYDMGYEIGKQCKALGVHMNLAPVVDVNNNPKNPIINDRSFGQDKENVARKAQLYMRGLRDAGIIACAKHFPGHGDTAIDSHYDLPRIVHTRARLDDVELYPFKKMIDAGIQAIMTAHLEIPALDATPNCPSSLSHNVVTNLLKDELGFDGVVITDGLGMRGITKHHTLGELELKSLLAGHDILLCPVDLPKAVATIKQAVLDGRLTEAELDKKVLKILALKAWANVGHIPAHLDTEQLHSEQAQALKQKLYAHALTVARDDEKLITRLQEQNQLQVIEIGQQNSVFLDEVRNVLLLVRPEGRTLGPNLKDQSEKKLASYHLAPDADDAAMKKIIDQLPDNEPIVIALLGMTRFAKQKFGISDATQKFLHMQQQAGKESLVIVFGNAYSLPLIKDADSVIVAYEDDVDAQKAAAQLLAGKLQATGIPPVRSE